METVESVIEKLRLLASANVQKNTERFGVQTDHALGIKVPLIRMLARELGKNHSLAQQLWKSEIHEARLLAGMIAVPGAMTPTEMDEWAGAIYSWDICDQCCINLFAFVPGWKLKISEWIPAEHEFTRRAGIVLATVATIHQPKITSDQELRAWMAETMAIAEDSRNFVRKAVSWQLRQIGKKRPQLREEIMSMAEVLLASGNKTKKWIGSDVKRELMKYA